ncbi:hypothetical protein B4135_2146 [Caldibacillus debilis]|uniref:Uncharacterized protein n=1 Tax=Caldibacillus debilis TaxID=301148 RepID=A0A150M4T8_9BACI|nr:hypothetical protein B4135_2146 [Caldibacillus debilis]
MADGRTSGNVFLKRSGEVDREYAAMLRGKTRAIPHSILKIALSILFFKRRAFFGGRASPGSLRRDTGGRARQRVRAASACPHYGITPDPAFSKLSEAGQTGGGIRIGQKGRHVSDGISYT